MIIDNKHHSSSKSSIKTVWDYLHKYTGGDQMNIVTGFFTISALSLLKMFQKEPQKFRLILSEIAGKDEQKVRIIDILQGNNDLSTAFQLQKTAQQAIDFFKQDNVSVKRINNAFCHAKTYIYNSNEGEDCYYVTGSSNLTEKGLGICDSSNVELNIAHRGEDATDFRGILEWFERTWKESATDTIDVFEDERKVRKSVKQYFIDCIESFCKEYMPSDIYYKILYELFREVYNWLLRITTHAVSPEWKIL